MAAIQGLRGTGQFDSDFRPKNYRELYTLLEPNGSAPLNALLSMTSSEATDDPEFRLFKDELPLQPFRSTRVLTTTTLKFFGLLTASQILCPQLTCVLVTKKMN